MTGAILVVDDNRDFAEAVALVISELGTDVAVAHSVDEAEEWLSDHQADVVLSDVRMPGRSGVDLLALVRERDPRTRVVLITAHGSVGAAVDAMKRGAYHYLTKPIDHDELLLVTRRALEQRRDEEELSCLRRLARGAHDFHGLLSRDRRMCPVLDTIRRVAPTSATVLIAGESGTGKELVARAIHAESDRAQGPFVGFNAAAVPETIAEAELFGARKGAYTGADRDRDGLFREATGGTIFIDEVASMPPALQGKLLRVLQEREVRPLGGGRPIPVDARIVAATNIEPARLLREGLLRKDLYYRLAVVRVVIPPLRERPDDIPLLAEAFARELAGDDAILSARALRLLMSHDWPGNVRELRNVVERAAVLRVDEEIGPEQIRFEDDDLGWDPDLDAGLGYEEAKRAVLERFQRRYVERLLAQTEGNLSAAAREAGITRAALHRIVKRLGIVVREQTPPAPAP